MDRFTFLTSPAFWAAAVERAIKTAAQAAVLAVGAGALAADARGVDALAVDWLAVASFAAGGAALSLLSSIGTGAVTDGTPSANGSEYLPERAEV